MADQIELNKSILSTLTKLNSNVSTAGDTAKLLQLHTNILMSINKGIDSLLIAWRGNPLQEAEDKREQEKHNDALLKSIEDLNKAIDKQHKDSITALAQERKENRGDSIIRQFLEKWGIPIGKVIGGLGIFQGGLYEILRMLNATKLADKLKNFSFNINRLISPKGIFHNIGIALERFRRAQDPWIKSMLPNFGKITSASVKLSKLNKELLNKMINLPMKIGFSIGRTFVKVFKWIYVFYEGIKSFIRIFGDDSKSIFRKILQFGLDIGAKIIMLTGGLVIALVDLVKDWIIAPILGLFSKTAANWLRSFSFWEMIDTGFSNFLEVAFDFIDDVTEKMGIAFESASGGIFNKLIATIKAAMSVTFDFIIQMWTGLYAGIAGFFGFKDVQRYLNEEFGPKLTGLLGKFGVWFTDFIISMWESVKTISEAIFITFPEKVAAFVHEQFGKLLSLFKIDFIGENIAESFRMISKLFSWDSIKKFLPQGLQDIIQPEKNPEVDREYYRKQAAMNRRENIQQAAQVSMATVNRITSAPVSNVNNVILNTTPSTTNLLNNLGLMMNGSGLMPQQ